MGGGASQAARPRRGRGCARRCVRARRQRVRRPPTPPMAATVDDASGVESVSASSAPAPSVASSTIPPSPACEAAARVVLADVAIATAPDAAASRASLAAALADLADASVTARGAGRQRSPRTTPTAADDTRHHRVRPGDARRVRSAAREVRRAASGCRSGRRARRAGADPTARHHLRDGRRAAVGRRPVAGGARRRDTRPVRCDRAPGAGDAARGGRRRIATSSSTCPPTSNARTCRVARCPRTTASRSCDSMPTCDGPVTPASSSAGC